MRSRVLQVRGYKWQLLLGVKIWDCDATRTQTGKSTINGVTVRKETVDAVRTADTNFLSVSSSTS